MHDLVIRSGRIVDGSGQAERVGDIAVNGDRIVAVGDVEEKGRREIDAAGQIVTPGWVDVHTHYDGQVTWDPEVSPSGWHGVTTVVTGNCGVGFAPARPEERDWLIQLMEGVEDIPGTALAEGMTWNWETFPEYLDEVAKMRRVLDVAAMMPHGALRAYVLGEGRANGPASDEEISLMAKYAREAIESGAVGLSTTRTLAHTDKEGQPAAGTFASAAEMIAIGDALGGAGRRVFSVVTDHTFGPEPAPEFAWMAEISRRNHIPVTYMIVDVPIGRDTWRDPLARGLEANRQGAWLVPQVAGKPASLMVGWESNYHLFSGHHAYQPLADLPHEEKMARLRDPEVRRALLEEKAEISDFVVGIITAQLQTGNLYPLGDPPDYEPAPSDSVLAIAERSGAAPLEVAFDMMMRRDGHELLYTPLLGYTERNLDALREMLTHPSTVLGLSDGGAHVGFICDGSMPTFMLTHWARDRHRGATIPLELAVHLQTRRTAELFGFEDRGLLAPGRLADINVIDFEGLTLGTVEMSYDLPAQGKRLTQRGRGYTATVKSGVVVRDHDEPTGERPGVLLRGPQPA